MNETKKQLILDLLKRYKEKFLNVSLAAPYKEGERADELYKWELITKCHNKTDVEIIRNFKPINVVHVQTVYPVLTELLKSNQQQLVDCFNGLKDESRSLSERLSIFKKEMGDLCGDKFKSKANDERTAAAFLTCWNPDKYTFFIDRQIYQTYCNYLGEKSYETGDKYPHYLQLISELAVLIKQDSVLYDKFQNETKGLIQSDLLTAQNILWQIKDIMKNKYRVQGLIVRDNTGWQKEFLDDMSGSGYGIIWKHQMSDINEVLPQLRSLIETQGSFDFYNISNNKTTYKYTIVDFATKKDYDGKIENWESKNPCWFSKNFSDYSDDNKYAQIVFLVNKVEEIKPDSQINIDDFVTFNNKEASIQNAVAYEYIKTKIFKQNMKRIEKITKILSLKKNIILQGAPGTGKTYNTAALALNICGETVPEKHEDVMKRYGELQEEGRIGFCTFHQSMDYEDFVEGIKPKMVNEQVSYEIEPGIFKTMCANAKSIITEKKSETIDFSKTRVFKMSLGEKGKDDAEIFDYCLENNVVGLGWGGDKDFSQCKTREDFKTIDDTWGAFAMEIFKQWMQIGDVILISDGTKSVKAIARIVGDYEFHKDAPIDMCQFRKVEWLYTGDLIPISKLYDKNLSQQSIYGFYNSNKYGKPDFNGTIKVDVINDIITGKVDDETPQNYVLIIDEINRGNVSKIFGELITLLEADKRIGGEHPIKVTLPYSKELFGVPSNLYIIGTMNTTDRSVGNIDYAVRRRFAFVTLKADRQILVSKYGEESKQVQLFDAVFTFLNDDKKHPDMDIDDLMVGHSYFMANDDNELKLKLKYEIIPLIMEYSKDGIVNVKKDELKKAFDDWEEAI